MDEQHASKYVNCDHERVRFQGFLSMTGQVHKPKTDKQVLSRGHLSFFQLSGAPSYADAMEIFDRSAFLRLVDIEFCDFIGLEKIVEGRETSIAPAYKWQKVTRVGD